MGNPRADRKMNDFRIFCELLAKTMLKAIDFIDVVEVYVAMKSPRYWALQPKLFTLYQ